jgi:hypothetical protein
MSLLLLLLPPRLNEGSALTAQIHDISSEKALLSFIGYIT